MFDQIRPSDIIRNLLNSYGIGTKDIRWLKILFSTIFSFYVFVQSVRAALGNMENKKLLFQAMEDVIFGEYNFWLLLEECLLPNNMRTTLSIIESEYFNYCENMTEKKVEVIKRGESNSKKVFLVFGSSMVMYFSFAAIFPLILTTYKFLTGEVVDYKYGFALEAQHPIEIDSYVVYFFIYSHNLLYFLIIFQHCTSIMVSCIIVLHRLTNDTRLLITSIKEIDSVVGFNTRDSFSPFEGEHWNISPQQDAILRTYLRRIVEHHNLIYRNLRTVNKTLTYTSLNINKTAVLLCCINLVCLFEIDEIADKIKYGICIVVITLNTSVYSTNGQFLQNEDENLRLALYECPWLQMPLKYQKVILMMLTRTTRTMQMRPKGFYAWNFTSFASVLAIGDIALAMSAAFALISLEFINLSVLVAACVYGLFLCNPRPETPEL